MAVAVSLFADRPALAQRSFARDAVLPDAADSHQYNLFQYRKLFRRGSTPAPGQLTGQWRGSNKGIVEIAGYRQFIKDIRPNECGQLVGDNIQVQQLSQPGQLRAGGWQPLVDPTTGAIQRKGKFAVQAASGVGYFGHGATFSYADGGNDRRDPARLLVDEVVQMSDHQMLGRATAKFGPFKIPLSYFVLERNE